MGSQSICYVRSSFQIKIPVSKVSSVTISDENKSPHNLDSCNPTSHTVLKLNFSKLSLPPRFHIEELTSFKPNLMDLIFENFSEQFSHSCSFPFHICKVIVLPSIIPNGDLDEINTIKQMSGDRDFIFIPIVVSENSRSYPFHQLHALIIFDTKSNELFAAQSFGNYAEPVVNFFSSLFAKIRPKTKIKTVYLKTPKVKNLQESSFSLITNFFRIFCYIFKFHTAIGLDNLKFRGSLISRG